MKHLIVTVMATILMSCSSSQKTTPNTPLTVPSTVPASVTKPVVMKDTVTDGTEIRCESMKDERILMIMIEKPGCALIYSKLGNDRLVAQSKFGTEHCKKVRAQIQKNLEDSGFKCK